MAGNGRSIEEPPPAMTSSGPVGAAAAAGRVEQPASIASGSGKVSRKHKSNSGDIVVHFLVSHLLITLCLGGNGKN